MTACAVEGCNEPRLPVGRCREHRNEYQRDYNRRNPEKRRAYGLMKQYGISIEEYNHRVAEQHGVCAICAQPPSGARANRGLHVDHDHDTGQVRGLLCHRCNLALGLLEDDPDRLRAMIRYLDES